MFTLMFMLYGFAYRVSKSVGQYLPGLQSEHIQRNCRLLIVILRVPRVNIGFILSP